MAHLSHAKKLVPHDYDPAFIVCMDTGEVRTRSECDRCPLEHHWRSILLSAVVRNIAGAIISNYNPRLARDASAHRRSVPQVAGSQHPLLPPPIDDEALCADGDEVLQVQLRVANSRETHIDTKLDLDDFYLGGPTRPLRCEARQE
ncbi:MAG: hypothetical protein HC927_10380 [Deltaproteobacteria bacterium]|nr:hypothetical protein [Deltaproteobacteria bacterium]